MTKPKPPVTPIDVTDPYMSVADIAAFLSVNKAYVYRKMREGRLPFVMIGDRRRTRQSDVKRYIEAESTRAS